MKATTMKVRSRTKKLLATGAVAGGLVLGVAGVAGAASSSTTAPSTGASSSTSASGTASAPADPATMSHGPNETLLTGSTAASVKAAALAAEPGATIVRVETDSGGAAYEAHMKKADGTYVTLKFDSSFKVTSTDSGFGGGPGGGHGPGAPAGSSAPAASGASA
jgi:hypothetical protein